MHGTTGAGAVLNAAGVEAPARPRTTGRIGESVARPDGIPKTTGAFAFSSDLWADGMLWGQSVALPAPPRPHPLHQHRPRPDVRRGAGRADRRRPPRYRHLRNRARRPAGPRRRRRPLLRRARGAGGRRPSRDRPAGHRGHRRGLRAAGAPSPMPPRRQTPRPSTPRATCSATSASATATKPPPGRWSSRATTRSACRTRPSWAPSRVWRCPPSTAAWSCSSPPSGCTTTSARSPRPSGCPRRRCTSPSPAWAERSAPARTSPCRSTCACLRCTHGRPVKMLYNRAGVVLRPRAPPPGAHALPPPRHRRRRPRQGGGRDHPRRRRLRLHHRGGARQRQLLRHRPLQGAQRRRGRLGDAHQQPAVRGHAGLRRGAGLLRPRGPDGPPGRRPGDGPPGAAAAQRPGARRHAHHRPADHRYRPRGRTPRGPGRVPATAENRRGGQWHRRQRRRRCHGPPRRSRTHRRRQSCAEGRRLRRQHQEPHVLRGLRRLLHGSLPAVGRRRHHHVRLRGGGSGVRDARPADRPRGVGRPAGAAGPRRHRHRVGRGRPPPAARPGCRAGRCWPPARGGADKVLAHVSAECGIPPSELALRDGQVVLDQRSEPRPGRHRAGLPPRDRVPPRAHHRGGRRRPG